MIESWLSGESLTLVRREYDWSFDGRHVVLCVSALWRLKDGSRLLLTSASDGHQFGLPDRVDAEARFNSLIKDAIIVQVDKDLLSADLRLRFSNGLVLEVITDSFYESWQAYQETCSEIGIAK